MLLPEANLQSENTKNSESREAASSSQHLGAAGLSRSHAKIDRATVPQRLIAILLDGLLLSPMITLFLSSLFAKLKLASLLQGETAEKLELWWLFVLSFYFLWALSTSLMIHFYGATLGGLWMKIKLHSRDDEQRPELTQILLRQFTFPLHFLLGGLSLLEVHTHREGLCFHDRLSETQWKSLVPNVATKNSQFERNVLRAWLRTVFTFAIAVFALVLVSKYEAILHQDFTRRSQQESDLTCANPIRSFKLKKLEDFIFLTQVGLLPKRCLRAETDLLFFSQLNDTHEKKSWAYLAMTSLSSGNDRKTYQDLACAPPETTACKIIHLNQGMKESREIHWTEAEQTLPLVRLQIIKSHLFQKEGPQAWAIYKELSQSIGRSFPQLRSEILLDWARSRFNQNIFQSRREPSSTNATLDRKTPDEFESAWAEYQESLEEEPQ